MKKLIYFLLLLSFSVNAQRLIVNGHSQAVSETTVSTKIAQSTDDARELNTNGAYLDSYSRIDLGYLSSNHRYSGWRFTGLNIPDGATIVSAYIQFSSRSNKTVATNGTAIVYISCEKGRNPPTFSSGDPMSARTWTTAEVEWTMDQDWTTDERGANQKTPNLAVPLQEAIDDPAYAEGHALSFYINNHDNASSGDRAVHTWDTTVQPYADHYPELTVTYTN